MMRDDWSWTVMSGWGEGRSLSQCIFRIIRLFPAFSNAVSPSRRQLHVYESIICNGCGRELQLVLGKYNDYT